MMCESKNIVKTEAEVDVGCGNAFGGSEDEGALPADAVTVNNIVDRFSYSGRAILYGLNLFSFMLWVVNSQRLRLALPLISRAGLRNT